MLVMIAAHDMPDRPTLSSNHGSMCQQSVGIPRILQFCGQLSPLAVWILIQESDLARAGDAE